MAYNFFGVYFEDAQGNEFRCGFHDPLTYMPKLEKRINNQWIEVRGRGANSAQVTSARLYNNLPSPIPFPAGAHTQNQRMELINQIVYNISRASMGNVNYGGAHI